MGYQASPVCEGGAMAGVYTAGVPDVLMEHETQSGGVKPSRADTSRGIWAAARHRRYASYHRRECREKFRLCRHGPSAGTAPMEMQKNNHVRRR